MAGINRETGGILGGFDHVRQSIAVLLTTPKMSRVMRRHVGAGLPRMVDAPINQNTVIDFYASVADALRLEPRFKVSRMRVESAAAGSIALLAEGVYYPRGHLGDFSVSQPKTVTVPL